MEWIRTYDNQLLGQDKTIPLNDVEILNSRESIGFAGLSAKWRIGSPLLASKSFNQF
jgi:hypothetical protein